MIGISGIARSGKDTMATCLSRRIKADKHHKNVKILSLANQLKKDLNYLIKKQFGFSAFTDITEEKNLIRPILVSYGEQMKLKYGKDIWIRKLAEKIDKSKFNIIADVRFDFEIDFLKENFDAFVIHITKENNVEPNDIEKINDPLVRAKSDLRHIWPPYEPDQMDLCDGHASIVWQMIHEGYKEKWKQI
jgi:hypothetical protein